MLSVTVCLCVCLVFPQIYNGMNEHQKLLRQGMGFCPNHCLLNLIYLFTGKIKDGDHNEELKAALADLTIPPL